MHGTHNVGPEDCTQIIRLFDMSAPFTQLAIFLALHWLLEVCKRSSQGI